MDVQVQSYDQFKKSKKISSFRTLENIVLFF